MKKIILAGGSGFIGSYLSKRFLEKGYKVVVFSRRKTKTEDKVRYVNWDGKNLSDWKNELENSFLLINLCGKTVATRHTLKNKKEILDSRINSTKILNKAVLDCKNPPKYWFNSSGATIYKTSFTQKRTEDFSEIEQEFLTEVILEWEQTLFENTNWEYRISATNILNTKNLNSDSFSSFSFSTSQYVVQPRYLIFSLKYNL